jgi:hypothetical protein
MRSCYCGSEGAVTKEKSAPENNRAPRLVGLGHTGVPCGYPDCEDRNASESVIRGRGDIDHDFGGTSMEPRCEQHRGLETPRPPRSQEPLPVDPEWKVSRSDRRQRSSGKAKRKTKPSTDRSGLRTGRLIPVPKPIDVPELNRMRTRANRFLARQPERTLELCARALKEEQRLLTQVGRRIRPTMDDFRRLRSEAKARLEDRGQSAGVPEPRSAADPAPAVKRPRDVSASQTGSRIGRPAHTAILTGQEYTRLATLSRAATARVEREPGHALRICDEALAFLQHRSGSATTLRKKFLRIRAEALIQRRRRSRR